ncbi:hypothetical protein ACTPOK_20240 [Streptomyces inhibens]|uniref:hypothetical protein n=1 Tax=Streptomyces inhibens TaxID=2293571 RepID=UPI00402AF82C
MDADDASTWPQPFADLIHQLADEAQRDGLAPDNYVDFDLDGHEDNVRQLLRGHLVRARHCTRLLDHEVEAIRTQGLRPLDVDLINVRLDQAHQRGQLTDEEHATLRAENCLTPTPVKWGKRDDQICLVLSTAAMIHHSDGLHRLLSYWGGEAIYWRYCETVPELGRKLRSLGRPALVSALLELSDPQVHRIFRSLVHVFVGKALGNETADAEVLYRAPVQPEHIEAIDFPGDPNYDRFPQLPRT